MTSYRIKCINNTYICQGTGFDKGHIHHFHFLTKDDAELYLAKHWGWGADDWEPIEVPEKAERSDSPSIFMDKYPVPRYIVTQDQLNDLYNMQNSGKKLDLYDSITESCIPEDAKLLTPGDLAVELVYWMPRWDDMFGAIEEIFKDKGDKV